MYQRISMKQVNVLKVRLVVGFTQLHIAVLGEVQHNDEDEPDVLGPDV